jgi:hypothetical protein
MTRPATVTQTELTRAAKAVAAAEHKVSITIHDAAGRVYRIDPVAQSAPDEDGFTKWRQEKARRGHAGGL